MDTFLPVCLDEQRTMKIEEEDIDMKYVCLASRLYEVIYIIHKMQRVIYNGWSVMRNSYEVII